MSPLPFLNSNILLRPYVRRLPQVTAATHSTILNNLIDGVISRTDVATRTRQNLEYWAAKEPYLSTHRTFANLDWAVALTDGKVPLIALSGWVVDLKEVITSLTVSLHSTIASTIICRERRPDVAFAFTGIPASFKSGFSALFRTRLDEGKDPRLFVTYTTAKKTSVQFDLALDNVSNHVAGPSMTPTKWTSRRLNWTRQDSLEALVVSLSQSALQNEVLLTILDTCKARSQKVAYIRGKPAGVVDETPTFLDRDRIDIVSSYAEAGALVAQMHGRYRKLIVTDPFSTQLVDELFPSVVALPDIPRVLWIFSDKLEHMPAGLHGDFVTFLRWQSPNFAAKLAAFLE